MVLFGAITARSRAEKVPGLLRAAADRPRAGRRQHPRPRRRPRDLRTDAALPGPGRRHGDRQRDDRLAPSPSTASATRWPTPRARIEATLALGATAREAAAPTVRRALRSGMITLVDSTKTTGLIFFPGTMVGMLLAGASPTDAVRLQLILLYTLLGSVSISALVATAARLPQLLHPGRAAARAGDRPASAGSTSLRCWGKLVRPAAWRDGRGDVGDRARPLPPPSGRKSHWFAPGQATRRRLAVRRPGDLAEAAGDAEQASAGRSPGRKTTISL